MKIKYNGELDSVTVRGVTFDRGKPVQVEDAGLAEKMLAWPDVVQVKQGRKKNDQNKT